MALLDPTDDIALSQRPAHQHEKTKHPAVCLAGGFAFLVGTALTVHLLFTMLG